MFGSEVLEVGVGVALLFLFVSLICTATVEAIEALLKTRAKDLERGIAEFFRDPEGALTNIEAFYEHPLIAPLYPGSYRQAKGHALPSYIPAAQFAAAVYDLATSDRIPAESPLGRTVELARHIAKDNTARSLAELESWFDGSMDRVAGWYKRRTQRILFGLGLAIAVILNIDAINVIQTLSVNSSLRQAAIAEAGRVVNISAPSGSVPAELTRYNYAELKGEIVKIGFPIGWFERPGCVDGTGCSNVVLASLSMALGWIITALAVTLGAPFWFDVLNKIMVIRSTVKPHEKSREEGSEDRADTAGKPG